MSDKALFSNFRGVVNKSDGGFADGARVQLKQNDINYGNAVHCVENGSFNLQSVERGTYSVHISLEGYDDTYITNLAVSNSGTRNFMLIKNTSKITPPDGETITQKYFISGVISLKEGGYANNADIQLMKNGALYGGNVTTNSGGAYTIYNIPNGNYSIYVTLDGYKTRVINISVLDENKTGVSDSLIKSYNMGDRGPAGGRIVYVGHEFEYTHYGFNYIEMGPEDIGPNGGRAIFGYFMNPENLYDCFDSKENTESIVTQYTESLGGDLIQTDLAAVICTEYILNGYKDWLLPTASVFFNIQSYGIEQTCNLKLNKIYWCSDTQEVGEIRNGEVTSTHNEHRKFRFDPELSDSKPAGSDMEDFISTGNGNHQYYVRPVRFF